MSHGWQDLSVAVEEEGKDVDHLIADEDMPRFNDAATVGSESVSGAEGATHKSG